MIQAVQRHPYHPSRCMFDHLAVLKLLIRNNNNAPGHVMTEWEQQQQHGQHKMTLTTSTSIREVIQTSASMQLTYQ